MYLGLDLSTQQLKGVIVDQNLIVISETSVHFDRDLPQYGTIKGVFSDAESGRVLSPVAMWVRPAKHSRETGLAYDVR